MQQNAGFVDFRPEAGSWPRSSPVEIGPNKSNTILGTARTPIPNISENSSSCVLLFLKYTDLVS